LSAPLIFVVGLGRSGTTLLQLMLCAHPRIYIAFESSFYMWLDLFPKRAPRRDFLEHFFHTPSFRWLGVDPERVRAELPDPLPRERTGEALAIILREAAALRGRVRYGDKTPVHAAHLGSVFRDFPDARVIHLTRDPRAAALSQSRMPWCPPTVQAGAVACELDRRAVAKFRGRVLQLRFEDLIADPRATMGRVLEHVGEPWDDAVLDHSRHLPPDVLPPYPWVEAAAGQRRSDPAAWKQLSPAEIRLIERIARRVMDENGYAPAALDPEPSRLAVRWAGLRQWPETLRGTMRLLHMLRVQRDPQSFYDGRFDAAFGGVNPESWRRFRGDSLPSPPVRPGRTRTGSA